MSDNDVRLAVHIQVGDGPAAQQIAHPVADLDEARAVMDLIRKTPGFLILARDSDAPVMFHCRHVVLVRVIALPDQPSQLARVHLQ